MAQGESEAIWDGAAGIAAGVTAWDPACRAFLPTDGTAPAGAPLITVFEDQRGLSERIEEPMDVIVIDAIECPIRTEPGRVLLTF